MDYFRFLITPLRLGAEVHFTSTYSHNTKKKRPKLKHMQPKRVTVSFPVYELSTGSTTTGKSIKLSKLTEERKSGHLRRCQQNSESRIRIWIQ